MSDFKDPIDMKRKQPERYWDDLTDEERDEYGEIWALTFCLQQLKDIERQIRKSAGAAWSFANDDLEVIQAGEFDNWLREQYNSAVPS